MTSPIPPAAAARCREVVRLWNERENIMHLRSRCSEGVDEDGYVDAVIADIDARLSALHRPAVSVERLRALVEEAAFYSADGKCSAVPLDSLQALIAEAEAAQ